jgi:hypothetical protein
MLSMNRSYSVKANWDAALCLGDSHDWLAARMNHRNLREIRLICNRCPIQKGCLKEAVTMVSEPGFTLAGVWGGLTGREIMKAAGRIGNVGKMTTNLLALSRRQAGRQPR